MLFDPKTRHTLLFAAEGAGKTTLMGMMGWKIIIMATALGLTGCLGATAPTSARMTTLMEAMTGLAPISTREHRVAGAWGTLKSDAGEIRTCSKHMVRFRSTKRQSEASGSPLQSYNFGLGVLMDEIQDSLDAVDDALARLRSAPNAPLIGTCTAKDSSKFRNFRAGLNPEDWTISRIDYRDAFAVHDSHWAMLERNLTLREFKRRCLALDVGPEKMVYHPWERDLNVSQVPLIGATDVTEQILSQYGPNNRILVGHDPGNAVDVSVLLKAYQLHGERRHRWWVVGEVTTVRDTTEAHIIALKQKLHEFGCNPDSDYGQPHIRIDPTAEKSIYTQFRAARLSIRPAHYKPKSNLPATIPKESRIDVVCRLLCNARGERWLMVGTDDRGKPVAEKTVESIELSERDAAYEAEKGRKGDTDITHWTTALGYALWPIERPRMEGAA